MFVRDNAAPSASVVVKLQGGRALSQSQVQSIVNLVASSVPGMVCPLNPVIAPRAMAVTNPVGTR